jgi:transcriptional regulator with XRE-family HTH domain
MYNIVDIMKTKKSLRFEQTVGEKIRSIRFSRSPRISMETLAERADLSRQTINNLELGKIPNVAVPTLMAVARALEVPIGVLVDDEMTIEAIRALELIQSLKFPSESIKKKKRS